MPTPIARIQGADRQRGRRGQRARARERRIAQANSNPTTLIRNNGGSRKAEGDSDS